MSLLDINRAASRCPGRRRCRLLGPEIVPCCSDGMAYSCCSREEPCEAHNLEVVGAIPTAATKSQDHPKPMQITLDYRNPTPSHHDVAVFVNGGCVGILTLRVGGGRAVPSDHPRRLRDLSRRLSRHGPLAGRRRSTRMNTDDLDAPWWTRRREARRAYALAVAASALFAAVGWLACARLAIPDDELNSA